MECIFHVYWQADVIPYTHRIHFFVCFLFAHFSMLLCKKIWWSDNVVAMTHDTKMIWINYSSVTHRKLIEYVVSTTTYIARNAFTNTSCTMRLHEYFCSKSTQHVTLNVLYVLGANGNSMFQWHWNGTMAF